ncbi:MAG TPA: Trk system potassium transporter TrkA [Thermoanaerobaculia bacterium]|nr:Trk system potassium transporter TrkA [Thermoanaerobaculia bacterium]HUM29248.1 Trk system potassium transporter TrkA [Thermoanaerobaculia bacterium]HXK67794.1 Trk system potassium transporter TrkA [Thermoanaerobaculia bacterium]
MPNIIIGAGEVGYSLATMLARENRDVVVIDTNEEALLRISDHVDAQTIVGHGASINTLKHAGIAEAEMVVAVTDLDEVNMIAAMTAKRLGVPMTVARVRDPVYLQGTRVIFRDILGIDLVINPSMVTAAKLAAISRSPGAMEIEDYADGLIKFMHFTLDQSFLYLDMPLKSFPVPEHFIIAAILREGELIIPSGNDILAEDDTVYVISKSEKAEQVRLLFGGSEIRTRRVAIAGGGRVGQLTARLLEREKIDVKLIERDYERCEELAAELARTRVIHGECTDVALLKEEKIDKCDLLIAATEDDSTNIISCLLAKELGTFKVASLVRKADFAAFVERFGIDVGVSPRLLTANMIFKHLRTGQVVSIAKLVDGKGEVLELIASEGCKASGHSMKDLNFPKGAIVAAVQKKKGILIPRGADRIDPGDHVIVLVKPEVVDEVGALFS